MKGQALDSGSTLQAAVAHAAAVTARVVTRINRLPAFASEDWCASAAQSLLPVREPSIAAVMLGGFDDQGRLTPVGILPGAAGSVAAEIGTAARTGVGPTPAIVPLDAHHPDLVRLVGALTDLREPGWGIPASAVHGVMALSLRSTHGDTAWISTPAGHRWSTIGASDVLCGLCPLPGHPEFAVIAEVGLTGAGSPAGARFEPVEVGVFEAVLPSLAAAADRALALGQDGPPVKTLTPKEVAILDLLIDGLSVAEIAERLGRSPHTVHDHVKSLHHKLGVRRRGHLVSRALGHISTER